MPIHLKENTSHKWFWRICIITLILHLLISCMTRYFEIPRVPEEQYTTIETEYPFLTSLILDIETHLSTPYILKEFDTENTNISIALTYHWIAKKERILNFVVFIILTVGLYLIFHKYGSRFKVHPILLFFGATWTGSALSNYIESSCVGDVADYIYVRAVYNNFIYMTVLNSADIFLYISELGLFLTSTILVLYLLWKTKQRAVLAFTILLLGIILLFSVLSTPSWIINLEEQANRQYKHGFNSQGTLPPMPLFDPNMMMVIDPNMIPFDPNMTPKSSAEM